MPYFVNKHTGERILITNPNHAAAFTLRTKVNSSDESLRDAGNPNANWEMDKDDKKDFDEFVRQRQANGGVMLEADGRVRPSAIEEFTNAKAADEQKLLEKQRREEQAKREEQRKRQLYEETERDARIRAEAEYRARAEVERLHANEKARKAEGAKRIDKAIETAIDKTNGKE
mgnify:CR=1 FL=1